LKSERSPARKATDDRGGKMKTIGITGNIGSGKSTVADYIVTTYKLPLIDVDVVAKEILEKNIGNLSLFSMNSIRGGKINYETLFREIFYDEEKTRTYNQWIHPLVAKEVEKKVKRMRVEPIIISAPLIFEARMKTDFLVLVYCEKNVRLKRLLKKLIEAAPTIENAQELFRKKEHLDSLQFPDNLFRHYCDFVITNEMSFEQATVPQIKKVMSALLLKI
jgi:dephospho-CoA kinase